MGRQRRSDSVLRGQAGVVGRADRRRRYPARAAWPRVAVSVAITSSRDSDGDRLVGNRSRPGSARWPRIASALSRAVDAAQPARRRPASTGSPARAPGRPCSGCRTAGAYQPPGLPPPATSASACKAAPAQQRQINAHASLAGGQVRKSAGQLGFIASSVARWRQSAARRRR